MERPQTAALAGRKRAPEAPRPASGRHQLRAPERERGRRWQARLAGGKYHGRGDMHQAGRRVAAEGAAALLPRQRKARINTRPTSSSLVRPRQAEGSLLFKQVSASHASQQSWRRPDSAPMGRSPTHSVSSGTTSQATAARHAPADANSRLEAYLSNLSLGSGSGSGSSGAGGSGGGAFKEHGSDKSTKNASALLPPGHSTALYAWGANATGQCGQGPSSATQLRRPAPVQGTEAAREIASVSCGRCFSVAVSEGGRALFWGKAGRHQFEAAVPVQVPRALSVGAPRIESVSCGANHAVGIVQGGIAIGWGANDKFQLGAGGKSGADDELQSARVRDAVEFRYLPSFRGLQLAAVHCGADFTIVVSSAGQVLGVGDNRAGQLGAHSSVAGAIVQEPVAMELPTQDDIAQIACGEAHTLVLLRSGLLLGTKQSGLLRPPATAECRSSPLRPLNQAESSGLRGERIMSVGACGRQSFVLTQGGTALLWSTTESTCRNLNSAWEQGVRLRNAVLGHDGRFLAVSFTSNVYEWEDTRSEAGPTVIKYFASQGARVNAVRCGFGFALAARVRPAKALPPRQAQAPESAVATGPETQLCAEEKDQEPDSAPRTGKCLAWGRGLKEVVAGQAKCEFQLEVKAACGDRLSDSEGAAVARSLRGFVCVSSKETDGRLGDVALKRNPSGFFSGWYSARGLTTAGAQVWVHLMIAGNHVKGSPFRVEVIPGPTCARTSTLSVQVAAADAAVDARVEERDRHGNAVVGRAQGRDSKWVLELVDSMGAALCSCRGPSGRLELVERASAVTAVYRDRAPAHARNSPASLDLDVGQPQLALPPDRCIGRCGTALHAQISGVSDLAAVRRLLGIEYCMLDAAAERPSSDCSWTQLKPGADGGLSIPLPSEPTQLALFTRVKVNGVRAGPAFERRVVAAVSQASLEFATARALGASSRVEDGFTFVPRAELKSDAAAPLVTALLDPKAACSIDARSDPELASLRAYVCAVCGAVPAPAPRARLVASCLGDWLARSTKRSFCPSGQALLYKYLLDTLRATTSNVNEKDGCAVSEVGGQEVRTAVLGAEIDLSDPTHPFRGGDGPAAAVLAHEQQNSQDA